MCRVHASARTSTATPAELARALRELEPRCSALLRHRLLEGRTPEACAALYGISPAALAVHLLRACLALEARLGSAAHLLPAEAGEEQVRAERLALGLAGRGTGPGVAVALRLEQLRVQVRAELDAEALREARSPRHRRNEWIRRLVVALLVAFTAWYTLGPSATEPSPPAARPR
jgi:hypothetical protein